MDNRELDSICRVCLGRGSDLVDVFDEDVASLLAVCSGVEVSRDDGLPSLICSSCKSLAVSASAFARLCRDSDSKLRSYILGEPPERNGFQLPFLDCPYCVRPCKSAEDLIAHAFHSHRSNLVPSSGNACTLCFREFQTEFELKKHQGTHKYFTVDGKTNVCPICREEFSTRRVLINHLAAHVENSPHRCVECRCCFSTSVHLIGHRKRKHAIDDDLFESFEVKLEPEHSTESVTIECEPNYSNSAENDFKLEPDEDISNVDYEDCSPSNDSDFDDKEFYDLINDNGKKSLRISLKRKKKSKSYKVKIRGSKSPEESTDGVNSAEKKIEATKEINIPKKRLPGELSYLCSTCGKGYCKQASLDKHLEMHLREDVKKPSHKCPICGKVVNHSNHLRVHMRTHKDKNGQPLTPQNADPNKKLILCSMCGKSCSSRSNLAVHMRRHLGVVTCRCKICGKGYPRTTDLTLHMRQHTGERPFVCNCCNKSFTRSDKLAIHMRIHTGEKPYGCQICNRAFAQSNDLVAHKKRNNCSPNLNLSVGGQNTSSALETDNAPTNEAMSDCQASEPKNESKMFKQSNNTNRKQTNHAYQQKSMPAVLTVEDDNKDQQLLSQARSFELVAAGAFANNFLVMANNQNGRAMNLISQDALTARAFSNLLEQSLGTDVLSSQRMLAAQGAEFGEYKTTALLQNLANGQGQLGSPHYSAR